jgi:segregation and condensation protein A
LTFNLVSDIINKEKDEEVIEKIIEKEINPEIEKKKANIILKVLEIVDRYELDPWNVDVEKFSAIFLNEINEYFRDFPIAGKIIYFAWVNLRNKSQQLIPKEEEFYEMDDGFTEEEVQLPLPAEEIHIGYLPVEKRNITVDDIVDAIKNTPMSFLKNTVRKAKKIIFQENSHPEDFHVIITEIWGRMMDLQMEHFPMDSITDNSLDDFINVFQSSLFLAYYGRIQINQEEPYGTIWIKIQERGNEGVPIPEVKMEQDEFAI